MANEKNNENVMMADNLAGMNGSLSLSDALQDVCKLVADIMVQISGGRIDDELLRSVKGIIDCEYHIKVENMAKEE